MASFIPPPTKTFNPLYLLMGNGSDNVTHLFVEPTSFPNGEKLIGRFAIKGWEDGTGTPGLTQGYHITFTVDSEDIADKSTPVAWVVANNQVLIKLPPHAEHKWSLYYLFKFTTRTPLLKPFPLPPGVPVDDNHGDIALRAVTTNNNQTTFHWSVGVDVNKDGPIGYALL